MQCYNCGASMPDFANFCDNCGTKLSDNGNYQAQAAYQQAPVQVNVSAPAVNEHVTTGGWFGRILLSYIPIVGLIMLFVWAFGNTQQKSLKTWARAQLIFILISIAIVVIWCVVGGATIYQYAMY